VLDAFRARAKELGFAGVSSLIEERVRETGPAWLRGSEAMESVDDYLHSGIRFVYLRARLPTQE
jgi:hypothetical protein